MNLGNHKQAWLCQRCFHELKHPSVSIAAHEEGRGACGLCGNGGPLRLVAWDESETEQWEAWFEESGKSMSKSAKIEGLLALTCCRMLERGAYAAINAEVDSVASGGDAWKAKANIQKIVTELLRAIGRWEE